MGEINIYVDGTPIADSSNGRYIFGQIDVVDIPGTGLLIQCPVKIQGSTTTELQTRWNDIQALVTGKDKRVVVTLDDGAATNTLEDISPLDGKHDNIVTALGMDLSKDSTDTMLWALFSVSAETPNIESNGQIGDIICQTIYNSGGVQSRNVSGMFGTTFDDDATSGLTLTSVSDSGGFAVFNVAAGAPAFTAGMKIKVASTTNYQSPSPWHVVTGITGNAITTSTAYIADDTGTLDVGAATSGLANFTAAETSLNTDCLGTESDGSRSSTTGLARVMKEVSTSDDNNIAQFSMASNWMEAAISALSDSARQFELLIDTAQPEKWDVTGGTRPTILTVQGAIAFDKDVAGRAVKASDWADVEAEVETQIKARSGKSNIKRMSLGLSASAGTGTISFKAVYLADNLDHFSWTQVSQEQEQAKFVFWSDADGYHRVQEAPGPRDAVYVINVNRIGPGVVDITPSTPQTSLTDPGSAYTYKLVNQNITKHGPVESDDFSDIYVQDGTFQYQRFRISPTVGGNFLSPGIV